MREGGVRRASFHAFRGTLLIQFPQKPLKAKTN